MSFNQLSFPSAYPTAMDTNTLSAGNTATIQALKTENEILKGEIEKLRKMYFDLYESTQKERNTRTQQQIEETGYPSWEEEERIVEEETTTKESTQKLTKELSERKKEFHTYENKQTRPIKVMARNLPPTLSEEEILDSVKSQGLKITQVNQKLRFVKNDGIVSQIKLPLFMLTFEHDEDRCTKSPQAPPKCCNCGEAHPANYRGCAVAKKLQELRDKKNPVKKNNSQQNEKNAYQPKQTTQQQDIETHLTNKSYIKVNDYNIYHTHHPDNQAHGGSAVLIRNNIKHVEELQMQHEHIQLSVITVTSTKQNIKLGAIYIPPKHNLKTEDYRKILIHMGERFIIGGDFNAKHSSWGSRLDNTKGKELFKATQLENCNIHATGNPTYWPTDHNKIPDSLDFFISRKVANNFIKIEDNLDLESDHTAQILTMSNSPILKQISPSLGNKTTDWNAFKCQLTEQLTCNVKLRTKEQLDVAVSDFTKLIQKVMKLRRKWQNSRNPFNKTQLNNKAQQIKRILKELEETSTTSFLENLSSESSTNHSLWKITKKLTKKATPIPPISVNNEWARTEQQKADSFANQLEKTFTPNDIMGPDPQCRNIQPRQQPN
ncbi:RNA-directed DNA polymerase from mobile element jockey [Orchesella cincta]|uniref:RNA-directed DNA polymerase from mobile element jockey n=1 Tax=Orchesella cincta TaxID=48709 RepID=A0A1D2M8H9_ORCCI|nr:RNA-directed DNA polymerase from mobile element jockey [Orchesella cincta]